MSFQYYNYYDDDSDGDNESISSSGDEGGIPDDIVLSVGKHGEKRRFRLEKSRSRSRSRSRSSSREGGRRNSETNIAADAVTRQAENSSSASGMEEEMERELDQTVEAAHAEYNRQISASASLELSKQIVPKPTKKQHEAVPAAPSDKKYDDVYFDSDEEQDDAKRQNRNVKSNDDLFYDPDLDEADEKWMDKIRRQYQPPAQSTSQPSAGQKAVPLPTSDAVLNCPACMSLLCVDCQRHDLYSHQYRAMFVFNCKVDHSQLQRYNEKAPKSVPAKKSRKRVHLETTKKEEVPSTSALEEPPVSDPHDLYCPVNCSVCNTCVAMFDSDEVYHFFNVLASHS